MAGVNVFITVDTEHSIGGAFMRKDARPVGNDRRVWGRIGTKVYGIPLIMDIADSFGLKLTFFVEVLNKYFFGENESREVCEYILKRGHDVQLHLHPNYLNFTLKDPRQRQFTDLIGKYDIPQQVRFLEEGREALIRYGVSGVCAFRAGCFGASETTLQALQLAGIMVDSSYNAAYQPYPCLIPDKGINDFAVLSGVGEFPITCILENLGLRRRLKPLDINGVSAGEIIFALDAASKTGQRNVTIIMHSFSFVKPRDPQYEVMTPRKHVIRRFERTCRFLAGHANIFRVRTMVSLTEDELQSLSNSSHHLINSAPARLSLFRYWEQAKDEIV